MTDTRKPPACHFDRALAMRVTRDHRDDCPRGNDCPASGSGCQPCTAPHCNVCGREHADNAHPQTCPECEGKIASDFADIRTSYAALAVEALEAGADGHLVAAAPIPGGTAAVLIGPTVRLDVFRTYHSFRKDHRRHDPIPPLAVLAQWEDLYRAFLGHDSKAEPAKTARWGDTIGGPRRATIGSAISYLVDQLPYIAQRTDGPDFLAFARQVRTIRADLERALHDEREPERGVECFECGDILVRRFRQARRCRHSTPARERFRQVAVELGYPEFLTGAEIKAARKPCGLCDQGGIDDPRAGLSWECPSCRREYKPGEYATAVRRDLLENGAAGDGWTHIAMAAEAATTLTGHMIPTSTVRKWMDRGKVSGLCRWTPGAGPGLRLVYWPDVADEAALAVERAVKAEESRKRRAEQERQLRVKVTSGMDPEKAGKQLGIHPARVEAIVSEWAAAKRQGPMSGKVSA